MTTIIIARHGNTFGPDDTPTRVGARTDLPLVDSGIEQARALGRYFKGEDLVPDFVYTSELQRTKQTAQYALEEMGVKRGIETLPFLNEIDYGPDENKPEDDVIARLGAAALELWDEQAIVPQGWKVDPVAIIHAWRDFVEQAETYHPDKTFLLVTSNGTARFAPEVLSDREGFYQEHKIKLKTGACAVLECEAGKREFIYWNKRPSFCGKAS